MLETALIQWKFLAPTCELIKTRDVRKKCNEWKTWSEWKENLQNECGRCLQNAIGFVSHVITSFNCINYCLRAAQAETIGNQMDQWTGTSFGASFMCVPSIWFVEFTAKIRKEFAENCMQLRYEIDLIVDPLTIRLDYDWTELAETFINRSKFQSLFDSRLIASKCFKSVCVLVRSFA